MRMHRKLVLASASPRRKELLEQLGYDFSLLPVDIDETPLEGELPEAYLPRMSKSKAIEAGRQYSDLNAVILASDTSVIAAGRILGKPKGKEDFVACMQLLSGNWHQVMTSIALLDLNASSSEDHGLMEKTVVTRVKFKPLSMREIEAYWHTGEPQDKAGGYGIQGKAAVFVEMIEGSYSNVVGLPLQETAELLTDNGFDICDIWLADKN